MKKIIILTIALLVVANVGLQVVYLTMASTIASESVVVERINTELAVLDEKNQILEAEMLSYASLQSVASRAAELGFDKPKEVISLNRLDSIARATE